MNAIEKDANCYILPIKHPLVNKEQKHHAKSARTK